MSGTEPEITLLGHAGCGERYCLERGPERWYVDVQPDGEITLATGFQAGQELDREPPAWVRARLADLAGGSV